MKNPLDDCGDSPLAPSRSVLTVMPSDTALVDGGVWAKLDVLVVLAAHHAQAVLLNWKGSG